MVCCKVAKFYSGNIGNNGENSYLCTVFPGHSPAECKHLSLDYTLKNLHLSSTQKNLKTSHYEHVCYITSKSYVYFIYYNRRVHRIVSELLL